MIVSLVGMPGCGKSTVGRHVARLLGLPFVDCDAEIEKELGHSIREHFEVHGEESFRLIEARVLSDWCQRDGLLLATGGGAVLREDNRLALKSRGNQVVYLRAQVDDLVRRLKHDTQRPLLQGVDPAVRLRALFAQRDPLYRELADFVIDTGRSTVSSLSSLLAMQLEMALPDLVSPRPPLAG
ncbi:shikimate kinase [Ideonella sp.]|uniref:shikimate kinase n=1 Tax=Ideonella sp. TaxID=1929293 RepID=UPI003BB775DC